MRVPREIVDALESVVGLYFSDVRHRDRAAFILCDELVEMACKLRARQHNHNFDMKCGFYSAWNAPGVPIPQDPLGDAIQQNRDTRNTLQHQAAAVTVDDQFCADGIMDAIEVMERCWPGALALVPPWVSCALRIVRLYSSAGCPQDRQSFEDEMREAGWRAEKRQPRTNEFLVRPGLRKYWALPLTQSVGQVEAILNALRIP